MPTEADPPYMPDHVRVDAPQRLLIRAPERGVCPKCSGAFCWQVEASGSGASFGDTYDHAPSCPILRCEHGTLWRDGCEQCDARHQAECEEDDDAD